MRSEQSDPRGERPMDVRQRWTGAAWRVETVRVGVHRTRKRMGMAFALLVLQTLVLVAGLALLGQGLVGAFNWPRRRQNLVWRLFEVIASPGRQAGPAGHAQGRAGPAHSDRRLHAAVLRLLLARLRASLCMPRRHGAGGLRKVGRGVERRDGEAMTWLAQKLKLWWLQRRANAAILFKRVPDAVRAYREMLEVDPRNELAGLMLGNLLAEAGDREGAVAQLEQLTVVESVVCRRLVQPGLPARPGGSARRRRALLPAGGRAAAFARSRLVRARSGTDP